jgi:hypothetical protein
MGNPADDDWTELKAAIDAADSLMDLENRIAVGYAKAASGPQRGAVAFAHTQAVLKGRDADVLDNVQKDRLRAALLRFVATDVAESRRIADLLARL